MPLQMCFVPVQCKTNCKADLTARMGMIPGCRCQRLQLLIDSCHTSLQKCSITSYNCDSGLTVCDNTHPPLPRAHAQPLLAKLTMCMKVDESVMLVLCIKFACVHSTCLIATSSMQQQVQWPPDLLKVLYVQHLHQGVDCQSLQDGIDGSRAHIRADVLLQAEDPPLGLKLMAVAAHHVHKAPEGLCLHRSMRRLDGRL